MAGKALSSRQTEVARLVADGKNTKAIAEALGIAPATVGAHLDKLYAKLDVHSRVALAAWWWRQEGKA